MVPLLVYPLSCLAASSLALHHPLEGIHPRSTATTIAVHLQEGSGLDLHLHHIVEDTARRPHHDAVLHRDVMTPHLVGTTRAHGDTIHHQGDTVNGEGGPEKEMSILIARVHTHARDHQERAPGQCHHGREVGHHLGGVEAEGGERVRRRPGAVEGGEARAILAIPVTAIAAGAGAGEGTEGGNVGFACQWQDNFTTKKHDKTRCLIVMMAIVYSAGCTHTAWPVTPNKWGYGH